MMRIVILLLVMMLACTSYAQTKSELNFNGSAHFGIGLQTIDRLQKSGVTFVLPKKRETLGENLMKVFGIDNTLPEPGDCKISLLGRFRMVCAVKK